MNDDLIKTGNRDLVHSIRRGQSGLGGATENILSAVSDRSPHSFGAGLKWILDGCDSTDGAAFESNGGNLTERKNPSTVAPKYLNPHKSIAFGWSF